jgi:O-antigen/teichoic acid export membrane protein
MLVGVLAGLEAAAGYGVVMQVVGALNVLNRPIQTYFLPRAAAAAADGGAPALGRVLRDVWLVAGPPHVAFIALIVCFPGTVLSLLYGERYAPYAGALEVFALVCALTLLYQVLALKAHALRRQRFLLFGQVASAALVFGLSPLLLPSLGLTGAGMVWLVVGVARVASAWLPTSAAVNGSSTWGGPAAQLRRRILFGRTG